MCNYQPHYFIELQHDEFKYFLKNDTIRCKNAHKLFYEYTKNLTDEKKLNILKGLSKLLKDKMDESLDAAKVWEIFCCTSEVFIFKAKNAYSYSLSERQYKEIKGAYLIDFKLNDIEKLFSLSEYKKITEEGVNFFNEQQNLFNIKNMFYKEKRSNNNFVVKELFLICDIKKEIFCIRHTHSSYWRELVSTDLPREIPYVTIKIEEPSCVYDIVTRRNNHINTNKVLPQEHRHKDKLQDFQTYFSFLQKDELDYVLNSVQSPKIIQNTEDT